MQKAVFFADDYRANVRDIFETKKLSRDTSFYIRNASITDPTLAPEGHSGIYVLVPVANLRSSINWDSEKESFREQILEIMEKGRG